MSFLEQLKTLIELTISKINMPIALFGKVEQPTYNVYIDKLVIDGESHDRAKTGNSRKRSKKQRKNKGANRTKSGNRRK